MDCHCLTGPDQLCVCSKSLRLDDVTVALYRRSNDLEFYNAKAVKHTLGCERFSVSFTNTVGARVHLTSQDVEKFVKYCDDFCYILKCTRSNRSDKLYLATNLNRGLGCFTDYTFYMLKCDSSFVSLNQIAGGLLSSVEFSVKSMMKIHNFLQGILAWTDGKNYQLICKRLLQNQNTGYK